MKLRPKFDREFLSVTNGQNYVTYGKKFLWNNKKIFPVNYMEMAVTYGEKSFMEQTPGHTKLCYGINAFCNAKFIQLAQLIRVCRLTICT